MIRGQIASDYVGTTDPAKINSMRVLVKNLCRWRRREIRRFTRRCAETAKHSVDMESGFWC